MSARLVLVCDVCGACTDDHYAHPLPDARFRARATGWTHRRRSSGGSRNKPGSDRQWVDLCPEHTYSMGTTEPIRGTWRRTEVTAIEPEPLQPRRRGRPRKNPEPRTRPTVRYEDGQGPYRLYTSIATAMREQGAGRGTLEQLRRGMFAPGVDFLDVAGRWATVETEERHDDISNTGGDG
jgi:hypothetical protein